MFKLNLSEEYKTPKCKVVNVHMQKVMCSSPYGDTAKAGNGFNADNTTDYSDEDF